MKLRVDVYKPKPEVIVEHKGEELIFLANVFGRKSFTYEDNFDVFDHINRYWASYPESIQDEIFSIYRDINQAFDYATSMETLYDLLNDGIKRLLRYHNIAKLRFWLSTDTTVFVPETVKDEKPDPNMTTFTPAKTYNRAEYFDLIAFSLFLRTIVPIWGEYIASIRKNSEMARKEYIAMQLLNDTGVLEIPAVQRLQIYISAMTANTDADNDKILSGFSTEDIGFLMLALVCVRRICLADLRGIGSNNALAMLFKFISQKTTNQPEGEIQIKRGEKDTGDFSGGDSGKHSILETYRKRTELSLGEIAEMEYALEDLMGIALRLEPTITEDEVMASIETAMALEHERVSDVQLILAGWLIKDMVTPHSVYYVSRRHNACLLGTLEAVLWKWNFKYLAALITSHVVIGVEEMIVSTISSREQIDPALVAEIKKYYPFEWSVVKKTTEQLQPHGVIQSIDHVVDQLISYAYRSTLSEEKLKDVFGEIRRKVRLVADIKSLLAKLIIFIEARKYPQSV